MSHIYKMRKATSNGQTQFSLTVPRELGEKINGDKLWQFEVTDDGILYRPVNTLDSDLSTQFEKAAWATA